MKRATRVNTVLVMGCWHLGSVIASSLARLKGNRVFLWDQNQHVSNSWRVGKPPIFEPGLEEMIREEFNKNLFWCENGISEVSKSADWIIFSYDTPTDNEDNVQLDSIWQGLNYVLQSKFSNEANFLITSQLPVGTIRAIRSEIQKKAPEWSGTVIYWPENLRLGSAIAAFDKPEQIILGYDECIHKSSEVIENSFRALVQNQTVPIRSMSFESAEMVKHSLNSFLGMSIVFANEVSDICETVGADAWDVLSALKHDSRVGLNAFLNPGLGFSGGTIARDMKILGKQEESNIFSLLYKKNHERNKWIHDKLKTRLGSLAGKKIVLLGVAYKPNTSSVRQSPAIDISYILQNDGARCVAIDPKVDLSSLSSTELHGLNFKLEKDLDCAFSGADAAILVTDWDDFKTINWENIIPKMKSPIMIDTKNFFANNINKQLFELIVPGRHHE